MSMMTFSTICIAVGAVLLHGGLVAVTAAYLWYWRDHEPPQR